MLGDTLGGVLETPGAVGPRGSSSAFLRVALVGPTGGPPTAAGGGLAPHTVALAHQLTRAGHDVTLVSWSPTSRTTAGDAFPHTVRSLAWNRPDTWVRTGRRLRGYDAVVIVHTGAAMIPLQLALLQGAGVHRAKGPGAAPVGPRGVVLVDHLATPRPHAPGRSLLTTLLGRVHGVLVHDRDELPLAARLGAPRAYAAERPEAEAPARPRRVPDVPVAGGGVDGEPPADLTAPWAAYVGAIEALAGPEVAALDLPEPGATPSAPLASRAVRAAVARGRRVVDAHRPRLDLTGADLPDWVRPADVLDDAWLADEARAEARRLGLPRSRDAIAAWAALGALAAVLRVGDRPGPDGGGRAALVVDESGSESPFGRWARACGFAPVDLGLTVLGGGYDGPDVELGSVDVLVRLHPGGCDASDVDEVLGQAAWALAPGGLLVLTLPLGRPGLDGALGPADVRAVVARAHELGFVLVGDLDGDLGRRMRAGELAAEATPPRVRGAAYGLVRLTLRRR